MIRNVSLARSKGFKLVAKNTKPLPNNTAGKHFQRLRFGNGFTMLIIIILILGAMAL